MRQPTCTCVCLCVLTRETLCDSLAVSLGAPRSLMSLSPEHMGASTQLWKVFCKSKPVLKNYIKEKKYRVGFEAQLSPVTGVSVPTRPRVLWAPPQIRWALPHLPGLGQPLPNRPLPGQGLMTELIRPLVRAGTFLPLLPAPAPCPAPTHRLRVLREA